MRLHQTLAVVGLMVAVDVACGDCEVESPIVSDRLIVRLGTSSTFEAFQAAIAQAYPGYTVEGLDQIPGRSIHLTSLDVPDGATEAEIELVIEAIEGGLNGVLTWGEAVYLNEGPEGTTGSIFVDSVGDQSAYREQESAQLIGTAPAHLRATGAGSVVAVLDTGIEATHPLFAGRIVGGGYDFIDQDDSPWEVQDELDQDGDGLADEGWGHGTFVSSMVLLTAPSASVLPIRVLDTEGVGSTWVLTQGMFHAIDRGVEVINISIASTYHSSAVGDAVSEARERGIVVVAAAGNCNRSDPRTYPAMQSHVFGVAGTDTSDVRCSFSNYHENVVLTAPGGRGTGDGSLLLGAVPGGAYGLWEGTSMGTPLVSGAVALIRSQHPEWSTSEQTHEFIELVLRGEAAPIDAVNPGFEGLLGSGRVDVEAAVLVGPIAPQLGDLDGDGVVGVVDLLRVIDDWGLVHSVADVNGDGLVGVSDLLHVLAAWTVVG